MSKILQILIQLRQLGSICGAPGPVLGIADMAAKKASLVFVLMLLTVGAVRKQTGLYSSMMTSRMENTEGL